MTLRGKWSKRCAMMIWNARSLYRENDILLTCVCVCVCVYCVHRATVHLIQSYNLFKDLVCGLCDETCGNTTTVKRHLLAIHKIDVDKTATSTLVPVPSVREFFTPSKPKLSKARSVEIDRHVAAYIARDGRPISTVEGEGFRELMMYLEPEYNVKSRATTTSQIKRMYDAGAEALKLQLSKAKYVAFTTDLWTSEHRVHVRYRTLADARLAAVFCHYAD